MNYRNTKLHELERGGMAELAERWLHNSVVLSLNPAVSGQYYF